MEKYRVDLSELAENDLRDIVRYISVPLSAPLTALEMLAAIEKAISGLTEMPQRYALVADQRLASMGYRKIVIKGYIVFFVVNEQYRAVDVHRILYARRDWSSLF